MKVLFYERQRFRQFWLWLLILGLTVAIPTMVYISESVHGEPDLWNFAAILLMLPLIILFLILTLETQITEEGVSVRYGPFQRKPKVYPWGEICRAYVRKYRPISEFGGWGIRGSAKNRALNVSGNMGLQLIFNDGRKLLIGTSKAAELERVLTKIGKTGQ